MKKSVIFGALTAAGLAAGAAAHQLVTLLAADMRDVHQRRRIVGLHPQHRAGIEGHEAFAGLQHRQRAQQTAGIEFGIVGGCVVHGRSLPGARPLGKVARTGA